ncbi:hypothetical protein ARMGADRAFT_776406 [Armillaria gallica]|uniref:Uncharacterized protein n=1 Tax=Armillaria gallica TaxID=47427 RepID=A0A2H3CER2_ARMGA|nr:hypothetical protein ARMGADRAFT_776406 [Armillaria gallica]
MRVLYIHSLVAAFPPVGSSQWRIDDFTSSQSAKMEEAAKSLTLSAAGSMKQMKAAKSKTNERQPVGIEWEIVNADSIVLLGITRHALRCV